MTSQEDEDDRVRTYIDNVEGDVVEDDVPFSDTATQLTHTTLESGASDRVEVLSLAEEWKTWGGKFLEIDKFYVCLFCVPAARHAGYKISDASTKVKDIVKHDTSKIKHRIADNLAVSKKLEAENGSSQGITTAASVASMEAKHYTSREKYDLLLRVVAVHHWAFSAVEEPTLARFLHACKVGDKNINRKNIRDDVLKVSANLRHEILDHLSSKKDPVLLMIDAGTIVGRSFVNLSVAVVGVEPLVLFWRSFEPQVRLQTAVIRECVEKVMLEFKEVGVPVIGCVADNASNMQNAINPAKDNAVPAGAASGEGDDDVLPVSADPIEPFINDEVAKQLETVLAAAVPGKFFFPIRCWAHTLQLIFQDANKYCKIVRKVFDFATELYVALKTRAANESMRRYCTLTQKEFHLPPRPCDTRWNSHFMFLKYIVENTSMIDNALRETDQALHNAFQKVQKSCALVAVALNPIAILTDYVQSDECTLTQAISKFKVMIDDLTAMRGYFSTQGTQNLHEELHSILDVVIKSANTRNITFLENTFVKIIRYFDNSSPEYRLSHFKFASEILKWFCNDVCTYDGTWEFANRELIEYSRGAKVDSLPTLSALLLTSQRVLVTEAAVERAFHTQALTHRPDRNRLLPETVETLLFLHINEDRFKDHVRRRNVSPREKVRDNAPRKLRAFTNTDILHVIAALTNNYGTERVKTRQASQTETKAMITEMSQKIASAESLFVKYDNGTWYRGIAKKPMNAQGEVLVGWVVGGTGFFEPLKGEWCFAFRPDPRRPPDLDWHTFVDQK